MTLQLKPMQQLSTCNCRWLTWCSNCLRATADDWSSADLDANSKEDFTLHQHFACSTFRTMCITPRRSRIFYSGSSGKTLFTQKWKTRRMAIVKYGVASFSYPDEAVNSVIWLLGALFSSSLKLHDIYDVSTKAYAALVYVQLQMIDLAQQLSTCNCRRLMTDLVQT